MSAAAATVFVALGANLGDRRAALDGAVAALRAHPDVAVVRVSSWIATAPEGGPAGQPQYLNGVLEARTALAPQAFLELLQSIERAFGRERAGEVRNGPRTLDLDLLTYDDLELQEPELSIPHPRMEERVFVLEPLASIAPERRLARCGRTVRERLRELRGARPVGPRRAKAPDPE